MIGGLDHGVGPPSSRWGRPKHLSTAGKRRARTPPSRGVRDGTFDADRSQVRCGNIPYMMAALRNTAIGLLRWAGHTNIAATCRRLAAQPLQALARIGVKFENCMALPWKGRSSMEIVQRREL